MDLDDFEPRQKKTKLRDLSTYSVDDLQEYIAALQAEIKRAEDDMAKKKSHKNAAAAFFKN